MSLAVTEGYGQEGHDTRSLSLITKPFPLSERVCLSTLTLQDEPFHVFVFLYFLGNTRVFSSNT